MRLVASVILLVAFSGCLAGPKLTVCVVDVESKGLQCYDRRTEKTFFLEMAKGDGFIAMPPTDFEKLMNYAKNKCQ